MSHLEHEMQNQLGRWSKRAWIVGAAGLAICVIGGFFNPRQFFFSYLFGYLFWVGLALGCFGLLMIHHLTGGGWGIAIRRFLETGLTAMPLLALLFLPLFFGLGHLYSWARPAAVAHDEILRNKHLYLNVPAFTARMVLLFACWIVLARLLNRWSLEQDRSEDLAPTRRLRALSGPALVLYALLGTAAVVDWIMVLENDWYSTVFPIYVIIGQMLSALSFSILMLAWLDRKKLTPLSIQPQHFHALGNLLLAFVMLWAYMAVSQLIVIWSGNLPREITWYLHRVAGGWKWVAVCLGLFHFAVPFFLLLSRYNKQQPATLNRIAGGVLCAHMLDVFWIVAPSMHVRGLGLSGLDFAAWAGIGGLWLGVFFARLKTRFTLPASIPSQP